MTLLQLLQWGVGLTVVALVVLLAMRRLRERPVRHLWYDLERPAADERFHPEMVAGLPKPARRFLLHAIDPGTPLARSVRIAMSGALRISRDRDPLPMEAGEILTPGEGFVWRARVKQGPVSIRGFDAYTENRAETRWWLAGLLPVAAAAGPKVARSAAGRLLGETALLLPGALLPCFGALWEPVAHSTARVRLEAHGREADITIEVDEDGSLRRLSFPRWNSDPANGPVGYLPFVSDQFSDESAFGGFTIPTRFRAGWRLGGEEEFAFFFPIIEDVEYLGVS